MHFITFCNFLPDTLPFFPVILRSVKYLTLESLDTCFGLLVKEMQVRWPCQRKDQLRFLLIHVGTGFSIQGLQISGTLLQQFHAIQKGVQRVRVHVVVSCLPVPVFPTRFFCCMCCMDGLGIRSEVQEVVCSNQLHIHWYVDQININFRGTANKPGNFVYCTVFWESQ